MLWNLLHYIAQPLTFINCCCLLSIVVNIVGEVELLLDQATLVRREVLWELEI